MLLIDAHPDLLLARGYTDPACPRIMYDNWMRFFTAAWEALEAA